MMAESGWRRAPWWLSACFVAVCAFGGWAAESLTVDVQLRRGVAAGSNVVIQAAAGVRIIDHTPGARVPVPGQGPASLGDTFTEEITFELPGYVVTRPTIVDAGDAIVSVVRVQPLADHTTVTIAVRQPVSYSISRPSSLGEFTVELRPRTTKVTWLALTWVGVTDCEPMRTALTPESAVPVATTVPP